MDELIHEPGHHPRNLDPKRKPENPRWEREGFQRQLRRGLEQPKVCRESRDELVEARDAEIRANNHKG